MIQTVTTKPLQVEIKFNKISDKQYIIYAQKELQKDKICYTFGTRYNTLEFIPFGKMVFRRCIQYVSFNNPGHWASTFSMALYDRFYWNVQKHL